jgi:hypothetical protein
MNIQPDFEELLRLLGKHDVDYMIVGGYALAFHEYPRFKIHPLSYHRISKKFACFAFSATKDWCEFWKHRKEAIYMRDSPWDGSAPEY